MKNQLLLIISLFLMASCSGEDELSRVDIIPEPLIMSLGEGSVKISGIHHDAKNEALAAMATEFTGRIALPLDGTGKLVNISISDTIANPEGYCLRADDQGVEIVGGSEAGVFYGLLTLEQMVKRANVPFVEIRDEPRFAWRGGMLDVSRHFQPKEKIKEYIDILAYHKMNKFHWHLTDGIGWRIEIKKYPELTTRGAWRVEDHPEAPWINLRLASEGDSAAVGGFYTQDDIREIVEYAAGRYIEVIPEIEMPGHSMAAIMCYPELSCLNAPVGSDVYCAGRDETFDFLCDVLDEVAALFPSNYIHVGGDEVGKDQWLNCPDCKRRMKNEKLKNGEELQSYFIKRISNHLSSRGMKMIGWDEIIEGGLDDKATVMSWTGWEGGIHAAQQRQQVVMCPLDYVYLDHYQGYNPHEPQAWGGYNGLKRVYEFPVVPPQLDDQYHQYVIGGQGNLWTENIAEWEHVRYMLLPRMAALSESLWSREGNKNWDNFARKVETQMKRYEGKGWNYAQSSMTPMVESVEVAKNGDVRLRLYTELGRPVIRYTLDGTTPNEDSELYDSLIIVKENSTLQASAFDREDKKVGYTLIIAGLANKATGATVQYVMPYNESYSGGGYGALTDNRFAIKRGDDKAWQGFEKHDMDVIVDLGEVKSVDSVNLRLFQHIGSTSVMLPTEVLVELSDSGKEYKQAGGEKVDPENTFNALVKPVTVQLPKGSRGRYVRVKAANMGVLPDWHPRKGGNAWVFTDEIIVN